MYEREITTLLSIAEEMGNSEDDVLGLSTEAVSAAALSAGISKAFSSISETLSSTIKWVIPSFLQQSDYDAISGNLRKTSAVYDKGILTIKYGSKKNVISDFMDVQKRIVAVPPGTKVYMPVLGESLAELYDIVVTAPRVVDELYGYGTALANSKSERDSIRPPNNVDKRVRKIGDPIVTFLQESIGSTAVEVMTAQQAYGNVRGIAYSVEFAHDLAQRSISKPSAQLHKSMSNLSSIITLLAKRVNDGKFDINKKAASALLTDVKSVIALSSRISAYWYLTYEYMNTTTVNVKTLSK